MENRIVIDPEFAWIIALRTLPTVLPLIVLLAACAAQRPTLGPGDLSVQAATPTSYRLKVVFVWGVGENPYREIVLRVRVGEEFYAKVSDEAGNYHAIRGTLRPKGGGDFLLPIQLTNWSRNGSTVGTMDLTVSLSQGFGGGTNAGGYSVTLLPDEETSSNQSSQATAATPPAFGGSR